MMQKLMSVIICLMPFCSLHAEELSADVALSTATFSTLKPLSLHRNQIVKTFEFVGEADGRANVFILTQPKGERVAEWYGRLFVFRKEAEGLRMVYSEKHFPFESTRFEGNFLVAQTFNAESGLFDTAILSIVEGGGLDLVLRKNIRLHDFVDLDKDGIAEIVVNTSPEWKRVCLDPELYEFNGIKVLKKMSLGYAPSQESLFDFYRSIGWSGEFPSETNKIYFDPDLTKAYDENEKETACVPEMAVNEVGHFESTMPK